MVIGICGKIASGKTEVMKIFVEKGFFPVYADKIVHNLYKRGGKCAKKIVSVFGKEFLKRDGSVDRIKLRDVVFADNRKLKILNNIVHPVVYFEITKILKRVIKCKQKIAIESAYFEKDFAKDFVDKIIWVERSKKKIIDVLVKKRGFSRKMADSVFELIDKPANVDFILKNYGSLVELSEAGSIFSSRMSLSIVS